ncbi:hypothetical protein NP233_g10052 [Leucocoprinus birnbaumii]|uniref:Uncharacterized protein n=1 Tax=Leucocoprinus birnbaumii TaxID=56174 RepID=A0AAD5VPX6_9AGAR|nr:hypothetical protein NP233_g10052 [Leucocoprinus birnbaumii]
MCAGALLTKRAITSTEKSAAAAAVLHTIGVLSNAILNVHATGLITIRLINYRRLIITCVGRNTDVSYSNDMVGILLESAAINVPVTIAVAVGLGLRARFGSIIVPVAVASQAFASILIIHRVAIGRAFDQRQEEELSQLLWSRDTSLEPGEVNLDSLPSRARATPGTRDL